MSLRDLFQVHRVEKKGGEGGERLQQSTKKKIERKEWENVDP